MKRRKGLRKYCAPYAKAASVAFESNFCQTVRLRITVEPLENMNAAEDVEAEYFDPIVS